MKKDKLKQKAGLQCDFNAHLDKLPFTQSAESASVPLHIVTAVSDTRVNAFYI